MPRRQRAPTRAGVRTWAVRSLALLVHVLAAVGAVVAGPWQVVWFLPAMAGSLLAMWLVRLGDREERAPRESPP
ncbi:hypothetical protein ACIRPR_21375 [Streptomyces griseoflavus]|uniref:hypothetical protein n=1 Tax=Streptomyces griseoflavus TaxID=35619 RepID=UPI0038000814